MGLKSRSVLTKILASVILTIIAGVILAVGISYTGVYNVGADSPHSGVLRWFASNTMRSSVKQRAWNINVPNIENDNILLAGINDFEAMCVGCHGAPGRDSEAMALGLNPPPPDLQESAAKLTIRELFWVTKHGIKMTGMPSWGVSHDDDAIWPVVAFTARLPEIDAAMYSAMIKRADGAGHHAVGGLHDHSETNHASSDSAAAIDVKDDDLPDEHDHSAHQH